LPFRVSEVYRFEFEKAATDAQLAELVQLDGLAVLEGLDLSFCSRVTDAGLAHLRGLHSLRFLDLRGCRVTDAGLGHLGGLTSLRHLNLAGCEQVTDAGLTHLRGLTSLRHLELWGCRVTDAGLAHLQGLVCLRFLGKDAAAPHVPTDELLRHSDVAPHRECK
jgi:hypothetical protein